MQASSAIAKKSAMTTTNLPIGDWSDPVTVAEFIDPTKPNTMYGLRFDKDRVTSGVCLVVVRVAEAISPGSCWA